MSSPLPTETLISEEFIFVDPPLESRDSRGIITFLCERLSEKGCVDASYSQSVIEREEKYPTGLPTLPYPVALPHADNHAVAKTVVAIAILGQPVKFQLMSAPDQSLDVRLVLLMAVSDPSQQVPTLGWIAKLVQNQDVISRLAESKTPQAAISVLNPVLAGETI